TAATRPRHFSRYSLAGVIGSWLSGSAREMQPQRVPGGAERTGVLPQGRGNDSCAPAVGAPFELVQRGAERVEQHRARAGDAAADDDRFRVGDVDERRDGGGEVVDRAEPDITGERVAGVVIGDEVV